jgi:hypothetical protein
LLSIAEIQIFIQFGQTVHEKKNLKFDVFRGNCGPFFGLWLADGGVFESALGVALFPITRATK